MREAALELSASGRSIFDPTQAAGGLNELAAAGLNARDTISTLAPVLGLATAGNIGVESSANAVTAAMHVFQLNADQAEMAANQMLAISNSTLLQAGDLEAAMGAIGRGAVVAHQSLEEMLPSMGLVRNSGVSAEVAAHSVSSALIFMSTHASERFRRLGVDLTDATGRFRPFLDIVLETQNALAAQGGTEAEQAGAINKLFGRFGMTAFSAITAQLGQGIEDANGNILRGAAAIQYLRQEMARAGGTIDFFLDRTLNTLPGQLQVLKAVAKSVAIEFGAPLAAAFKPVVALIVGGLQRFRNLWKTLPDSIKTGVVQFLLLASALMTLFGGFVLVSGVVAILVPMAKVMFITFAGILAVVIPLGLAFAAAAGFVYLFGRSLAGTFGGLGSLQNRFERFRLVFEGLSQLFSQGGFSGSVRKELNKAENAGIRRFVVQVYMLAYRVEAFIKGVAKGVDLFLSSTAPSMRAFVGSVRSLAVALGLVDDHLVGVTKQSSKTFGAAGLGMGRGIVVVFRSMVDALTKVVEFVHGMADGIRDATTNNFLLQALSSIFSTLGSTISWVAKEVFGMEAGFITARDVGYVVGVGLVIVFGALAAVFGIIVITIGLMVAGMVLLGVVLAAGFLIALSPALLLLGAILAIYNGIQRLRGQPTVGLADLGPTGPANLTPGAVGSGAGYMADVRQRVELAAQQRAAARSTIPTRGPIELDQASGMGTAAGEQGGLVRVAQLQDAIVAALDRRPPPQVAVTTQIDGDVIARHVTQAQNAGQAQAYFGHTIRPSE